MLCRPCITLTEAEQNAVFFGTSRNHYYVRLPGPSNDMPAGSQQSHSVSHCPTTCRLTCNTRMWRGNCWPSRRPCWGIGQNGLKRFSPGPSHSLCCGKSLGAAGAQAIRMSLEPSTPLLPSHLNCRTSIGWGTLWSHASVMGKTSRICDFSVAHGTD